MEFVSSHEMLIAVQVVSGVRPRHARVTIVGSGF